MNGDYIAITNLIALYATHFDSGSFEEFGALFAEAGTLRLSGSAVGASGPLEISAAAKNGAFLYEDGTPLTRHVVTNLHLEIDPSEVTAACQSYFTVFQATPDLALQAIALGRYHDRFIRLRGTWLFASRVVFVDHKGDLSHHVKIVL